MGGFPVGLEARASLPLDYQLYEKIFNLQGHVICRSTDAMKNTISRHPLIGPCIRCSITLGSRNRVDIGTRSREFPLAIPAPLPS